MRHRYSGRKLNKTSSHKRAMFRNMTASLVEHELIKTTLPKAKELRGFAEPLITLAKEDSVANRRLAGGQFSRRIPKDKPREANTSLISVNDFLPKLGVFSNSTSVR